MTDIEFSIEIERLMRLQGCLGIFRVFGRSMEIFMGSVLTGDNAGYPSPYDFALGGQGLDPALPGGANKTPLKEGQSVTPPIRFVWISKKKLLPLPDRVLPVKCFTTQQSKWSKQPDLPTNLWEQDNKPNLSVTASGLKLTKLRYWLPA